MDKDIVEFFGGNTVPAASTLSSALTSFAAAKSALLGTSLLKLAKGGHWVFGANDDELPDNSLVIVNPASIASGYIAWYNNEPEQEVMKPLTEGPVDITTLPTVQSGSIPPGKDKPSGRGWETQVSVRMVTEDDVPLQLEYKVTSKGGIRAMLTLAGDIAKAVSENPDRVYPVVRLGVDSYLHKNREYGKIYVPILEIVKWLDKEGKEVGEPKRKLV